MVWYQLYCVAIGWLPLAIPVILLVAFQRLKLLDPIDGLAIGLPPSKTIAIHPLERGGFSLFVVICKSTKVAENQKPFEYLPYFIV